MLKNQRKIWKNNRTILSEKVRESITSVLPITGIVFLLCFFVIPVPIDLMLAFIVGSVFLVIGMGLFTLGTDMAMTPIGEQIGSSLTRSRRLWMIIAVGFLAGTIITVTEPDLQVLANQVPNVPNPVLIWSVAAGVGVFLVIALLRILLKIRLSYILIGFYMIVFIVGVFVPPDFLAVAFDSGGVTTGPMTVPFIMALGIGVASSRNDGDAENDSFGLVALCSVGPILATMVLGLLYRPEGNVYSSTVVPNAADSHQLWRLFSEALPDYLKEVLTALLPILIFFGLFQVIKLRLDRQRLIKICVGLLYTCVGLLLFLTGVNVGFMPLGNFLGQQLGALEYNWIVIPIGAVIGYFIVAAEPAVHILNKQVYEMTSGAISKQALRVSLSVGVAVSVGLAMLRIIAGIPILYFLVPFYILAAVLTFFVPPIFTAIAFDSGGVASGPMTATFLLPLAMGVCQAMGGNSAADAFGVVAMVAMTPLITIQMLGLFIRKRGDGGTEPGQDAPKRKDGVPEDSDIIEF